MMDRNLGKADNAWVFSDMVENSNILDTQGYLILIRIWSNFMKIPDDHKMLEEDFFSQSCVSCVFFFGILRAQCVSLYPAPDVWVVRDTNNSTSSGSTMVTILLSTRTATRPFSSSVKSNW